MQRPQPAAVVPGGLQSQYADAAAAAVARPAEAARGKSDFEVNAGRRNSADQISIVRKTNPPSSEEKSPVRTQFGREFFFGRKNRSLDGDGDGGHGAAEGIRGVEGVGGGLRGSDNNACRTDGADLRRDDDIGRAIDLPRQRNGRSCRNGSAAGREGRNLRGRAGGQSVLR